MDSPALSIVIVNWNGGQAVLDCMESIFVYAPSVPFEVLVVDNASTDGSADRIAEKFPQARVFWLPANSGFAAGNNYGMERATGRLFLLLNNDTQVTRGSLDALLVEAESHPEAGLLGPRLLYPDGSLQPSAGIFPNLWTEFLDQTMLHRLVPTYKLGEAYYANAGEVDWLTGACLLVRRKMVDRIGGMDQGYFMFLEDVDWAWRAREAGWRVRYTPAAEIIHRKGHSSKQALGEMLEEDQRSMYRFFRCNYGASRLFALRLIVSLGCLVRGAFWTIRGLLGKRREATERIRAYTRIFFRTWVDRSYVWGE